ncbi:MAG TPA: S41 family peptidase [Bacillota bacterium]|nr:S41 family peptidase [Bacillota bacterium]
MNLRKRHIILLSMIALLLGFIGAYFGVSLAQSKNPTKSNDSEWYEDFLSEDSGDIQPPENISKVTQAYGLIKQHYIEEIDDDQLIEGAIQGMLSTLEDPYSTYMDPEEMEEFNEQIESSFEGIGAEVSMMNGQVTIVAPIKDSPAEKAGLRPNDQVLSVDDESLEGLDLNEAVNKIRGEKGSEVVLKIKRSGATEPFEVTIVRDTIPVETVYSEMITDENENIGLIEITNFSEGTAEEFNDQLTQLESDGMDGLIIDVRGNPGGLLNSVEEILEHFIPSDIPYIQIEDPNGETDKHYTDLEEKKDYPITVLVDEGSASASEILAVAMKEVGYDVIGTTSFGKGTVQQAVPLGDGSTIKLTFYKWLSPKGNWINEKGVKPTIEVKQPEHYHANPVQIKKPLKFDQTGENIENIQQMLKGLGFEPGRTDGYFDKGTVESVKAFQKEHDLKVTGEVDEETGGLIETKLIEFVREGKDDQQLEKAIESLQ